MLLADEYESGDTSDEEDRRNTVGDVPMWWYNEYPHVGYDLDGRRIIKPPQRDQIDEFLKSVTTESLICVLTDLKYSFNSHIYPVGVVRAD